MLAVLVGSKTSASRSGFSTSICNRMDHITTQLQQLLSHLAGPVSSLVAVDAVTHPTSVAPNILLLSKPENFSGDSDNCRAFLVQCELHF